MTSALLDPTLGEAIAAFPAEEGLDSIDAAGASHWYPGQGVLHFRLPNFEWRKQAIARHDAHHLLTGYPCTRAGEMQMAAWEFAAGRYPHPGATAFCLPLVAMGAVRFPRRTFVAFVRGRRGKSLYSTTMTAELLSSPISQLRSTFAPAPPDASTIRDKLAFLALVGLSATLVVAPLLLVAAAITLAANAF